jgi:hypothetical protein
VGGQPPAAFPGQRHGRRRWAFIGATLAVVVLALVGWLLWRGWVPSAPANVSAQAPTASSVQFTWTAPTEGPDVDRYLVLRNAVQVGSVSPTTRTFTDDRVLPDTTYRYTVVAASGSKRSDPSAELVVHTLPAQPAGLRTSDTTATEVVLTWSEPDRGPTPESWVVLRDGTEVATLNGSDTTYTDAALAPATRHAYRVVASSGTVRSEPSEELVVTTLPATPTGLKATTRTTTTVTIAWGFPAGSPVETFAVLRDGNEVATVPGAARAYVDKGLRPATEYSYTVVAISGEQRSAEPADISVGTLTPPVADGRLGGSYDVDGKVTKSTAGITLGSAAALGQDVWSTWKFTPKCTTGACDAVLAGRLAGHSFTMTLVRTGAVYAGTTKAHVSHCDGLTGEIPVTNTVALQLTVRAADLRSGVWSAESWAATLRVTSPYTSAGTSGLMRYYCPAGSLTASLTGTR